MLCSGRATRPSSVLETLSETPICSTSQALLSTVARPGLSLALLSFFPAPGMGWDRDCSDFV